MALHVYRSNRMETLVERLGMLLREAPLPDPLEGEVLVVQSYGMRRWLSLELARMLGVSMHCRFPYPANFAQEIFRSAGLTSSGAPAFDRAYLPWRIDRILANSSSAPWFTPLGDYIGSGEASEVRRFELAGQLAELFDRLIAYRPEDLMKWEETGSGDWKGVLWQQLLEGGAGGGPPNLLRKLQDQVSKGLDKLPGIPSRITLFGISSLPPFYLHLIRETARVLDAHLFLFEPTDQFWSDLRSQKEQRLIARKVGKKEEEIHELHFDVGNSLLSSLGKLGRDFAAELVELEPDESEELFEEPEGNSLLSQVQLDIYEVKDRVRKAGIEDKDSRFQMDNSHGETADELQQIHAAYASIQAHCCHSPLRELEVLHDQLLAMFDRLDGLRPMDIVVMMPDVERYAHLIEAVFDTPENDRHRIPFTIADRATSSENQVVQTFARVLDFAGSRFRAGDVLSLLEMEPVRSRFAISESDLEMVREWIEAAAIRWGMDGEHRSGFGVPLFEENAWRTGFDRLLLGYAWKPGGDSIFEGILPVSCVEGGLAETLGRFIDFAEKLFSATTRLTGKRSPAEWGKELSRIAELLLDDSEPFALQGKELRRVLQSFYAIDELHPEPVEFGAVRMHLDRAIRDTNSGSGFMAGRMTFCSLKPMRSIPFRVVCILGMDDGGFPRRDAEPFAQWLDGSRAGRSRRDEDRQLFLEAFLSARDVFSMSYSGLSQKDNSHAPPSPIMSELLDYVGARRGMNVDSLVVRHPLHAYSPIYFEGDARLFSYSQEYRKAASGVCGAYGEPQRQNWRLPVSDPEMKSIGLEDLIAFFRSPARYFLKQSLGVCLPDEHSAIMDLEPMSVDPLQRWQVRDHVLEKALQGASFTELRDAMRFSGKLPVGADGDARANEIFKSMPELKERFLAASGGGIPARAYVDAVIGDRRLRGMLHALYPNGQILLTVSDANPRECLKAWLRHLTLQVSGEVTDVKKTTLITRGSTVRFREVENARMQLEKLMGFYLKGQSEPLTFSTDAAYCFARRTLRPTSREKKVPAAAAQEKWIEAEASKPENRFLFPSGVTFDDEWQTLAIEVFEPLFEHEDGL